MKTVEFANRADLNEAAPIEPPHLDLHCLSHKLWILNMIQSSDGRVLKIRRTCFKWRFKGRRRALTANGEHGKKLSGHSGRGKKREWTQIHVASSANKIKRSAWPSG